MPQLIRAIQYRRPEPSEDAEPLSHLLVTEQHYPDVAGVDCTRLPHDWSHTRPHRLRWRQVAEWLMGTVILAALPALWLAWWVGWVGQ